MAFSKTIKVFAPSSALTTLITLSPSSVLQLSQPLTLALHQIGGLQLLIYRGCTHLAAINQGESKELLSMRRKRKAFEG